MDRFIAKQQTVKPNAKWLFKIQYGQIYSQRIKCKAFGSNYLKSNMDRFIAIYLRYIVKSILNLKSNMDRFIGILDKSLYSSPLFKIQYGQIYSDVGGFFKFYNFLI